MEMALYAEPDGFYASGGGAGRAGRDFVTSPEVGTLFGALVARALDGWWRELGEPDPFVVVEAGAGRGRLAADVLRAAPDCAPALRYVLVERGAQLRGRQPELLRLEPFEDALGPMVPGDDDEPPRPIPGTGPIVTSLANLPALAFEGVVLANELLDNLPFALVERGVDGWNEVRVGLEDETFVEVLVPARDALVSMADVVEIDLGGRVPVPVGAADWIREVGHVLGRGVLCVIDYVVPASQLAGAEKWLRTYRAHERGGGVLIEPGAQDITADVVVECLEQAAVRAGFEPPAIANQRDWLVALGIEELTTAGRAIWEERKAVGDLEAIAARSVVHEAEALTDPDGLGAHRVLVFVT